jgi:hypothetical protein
VRGTGKAESYTPREMRERQKLRAQQRKERLERLALAGQAPPPARAPASAEPGETVQRPAGATLRKSKSPGAGTGVRRRKN